MLRPVIPRVKICCIASVEEARLAINYGADALGLVSDMPSGPGILTDEAARAIAAIAPPTIDTFLLTSRTTAPDIADHARYCQTTTVQVVQHIDPAELEHLHRLLPGIRLVQVIHVENEGALELIPAYTDHVSAFLLDSGRPSLAVPELGGTGRTHDWSISAQFVEQSEKPVFLAGGLDPHNVAQAITTVQPFGLDLCSGIRTNQQLDETKLSAYVKQIRNVR